MITVATLLWDANEYSRPFSRCYDETWVEKLCAGFTRHLTMPCRFVVFTDRERVFSDGIVQMLLSSSKPHYGHCIEPFKLNEPMIVAGLDTIITGSIDHLANYCFKADRIALPRDPFQPHTVCNGVTLVPAGHRRIFDD